MTDIWTNDAFGTSTPTGTGTVNLRTAGQYYDSESGLFYNRHRYYNPAIGRFLSSDPIGLAGGGNTFGYVGANPVNYTDLLGLTDADEATRKLIVQVAQGMVGSKAWADEKSFTQNGQGTYGEDTNKCNAFVSWVLTQAGASPGTPNGLRNSYPPTAGQWADPAYEIPGWRVLSPTDTPQPGDVVAQQIPYADASGHVMIVGTGGTVIGTGDSTSGPHGTVEQIPMPASLGPNPSGPMVFRRWYSQ